MRSSELREIEKQRAEASPHRRRIVHRDLKPENVVQRRLRAEIEQEFREAGARVFREEGRR